MSFTKINYVDNETIITAESLNNIQNAILSIHQNATFVGDLNEACEPGHYWIRCADCTNTPYGDNREGIFGFLEVIAPWNSSNQVEQRFINYIDGKTFVRSSINGWKSWTNTALLSYPVGSIYQTTSSTSPASLFGGVWEQIMDRFLLADGSTYTAGKTGGAATHKHTEGDLRAMIGSPGGDPSGLNFQATTATNPNTGATSTGTYTVWGSRWANSVSFAHYTPVVGYTSTNSNMPPYLVVYIWKRIS